jgi:hypothetical protein
MSLPRLTTLISLLLLVFLVGQTFADQQLLTNPGFEEGNNGWIDGWYPYQAGNSIHSIATHTGSYGLYAYTDSEAGQSFSYCYQQVTATVGEVYTATAWIKYWPISGDVSMDQGTAWIRIEFVDGNSGPYGSGNCLAYYHSIPVTAAETTWSEYSVISGPAPANTVYVRYYCLVEKPSSSIALQSRACFDDCYLTIASTAYSPQLSISPQVLGLAKSEFQKTFQLKNNGSTSISWQATPSVSWITTISPSSGTLATGSQITVKVYCSRAGLTQDFYQGTIDLNYSATSTTITVYFDMPSGTVPTQPSLISTNGYQLLVQKRLTDGTLAPAQPYSIKGVAWSPASIGDSGDKAIRRTRFKDWYITDIKMLRDAFSNSVYTFLDFGTTTDAKTILDYLYKQGIMAIITVDEDGKNNTANITTVVNAYKNHPAVLMWAIGNEWNINLYQQKFTTLDQAAAATQSAAQQIKAIDSNHPVATIFGEINIPDNGQPLSKTSTIVNVTCSAVDVWGLNIYRGSSFGDLFTQWKSITNKPMFLSEFGTDSYRTQSYWPVVGYEDQNMQQEFNHSVWSDITANYSANYPGKVCLGGTVFEWCDEWWKVKAADGGSVWMQDNGGFNTYWNPTAHPDGFGNEEYFGVVDINRVPKPAYYDIQNFFTIAGSNFLTAQETTDWILEPYGDASSAGSLSWISSHMGYQGVAKIYQLPGEKAKLTKVFSVPTSGWYTATTRVATDITALSQHQKIYLYLQGLDNNQIKSAATMVIAPYSNAFSGGQIWRDLAVSYYAINTHLAVQLVAINPADSGTWGSLYFDEVWVKAGAPQPTTPVALNNPVFENGTTGWLIQPYGDATSAGLWDTWSGLLFAGQGGGQKGKVSQLYSSSSETENLFASVWVYSDVASASETQKVYLYSYDYLSYDPYNPYGWIVDSGNVTLYAGKWTPRQWQEIKIGYKPYTHANAVQMVSINPPDNPWATIYFDTVEILK